MERYETHYLAQAGGVFASRWEAQEHDDDYPELWAYETDVRWLNQ